MPSPTRTLLSGLAGLAVLERGMASSHRGRGGVITDDGYFYGQSPPVYPSRESPRLPGRRLRESLTLMLAPMTGGDWAQAHEMALDLVGKMTLEEKVRPSPLTLVPTIDSRPHAGQPHGRSRSRNRMLGLHRPH